MNAHVSNTLKVAGVAFARALGLLGGPGALAADMPNACPVDRCQVTIAGVKAAGDELELTFDSNFTPDVAKNHFILVVFSSSIDDLTAV